MSEMLDLTDVRRIRLGVYECPETPFLLRGNHPHDPILSVFAIDFDNPPVQEWSNGWGLTRSCLKMWCSYEIFLRVTVDKLMLLGNTQYIRIANHFPAWAFPEQKGYRRQYRTRGAAMFHLRKSHTAFMMLLARVSFAIALWEYDTPNHDRIDWVRHLGMNRVEGFALDLLQESIVSKFNIGTRVGCAISPKFTKWMALLPVYLYGKVPVLAVWEGVLPPKCFDTLPDWENAYPTLSEANQSVLYPPVTVPEMAYKLRSREATRIRLVPDFNAVYDHPPFGPFQLQNETCPQFFNRMHLKHQAAIRRERSDEQARRRARESFAASGVIPGPNTRVYIWLNVGHVYPTAPARWKHLDYRQAVPSSVIPQLWTVHPRACRKYWSAFDTYDLWVQSKTHRNLIELVVDNVNASRNPLPVVDNAPAQPPLQPSTSDDIPTSDEILPPDDVLSPSDGVVPPPTATQQTLAETFHQVASELVQAVRSQSHSDTRGNMFPPPKWAEVIYGFHASPNSTYRGDTKHAHVAFGMRQESLPRDEAIVRNMAGWSRALLDDKLDALDLQLSWDLDPRNPNYLGKPENIRRNLTVRRWVSYADEPRTVIEVLYKDDPTDQTWHVVVAPDIAVFLIRKADVKTSRAAVRTLQTSCIPFNTVRRTFRSNEEPQSTTTLLRQIRSRPPTCEEYPNHRQRIFDILHHPHMRAALCMGGIVARLATDAIACGDSEVTDRVLELVALGPSCETAHHKVIFEDTDGRVAVDDTLSEEEIAIICGAYRVYTGTFSGVRMTVSALIRANTVTEYANQEAEWWWWPSHRVWTNSGQNVGHWSAWNEEWYATRRAGINNQTDKMRKAQEWKRSIRKGWMDDAAKVVRRLCDSSITFLDKYYVRA